MPSQPISEDIVRKFLSVLEELEARLLSWGVVDGAFSQDELDEFAASFQSTHGDVDDPEDLIDALFEVKALCEFNVQGKRLYRTRMAETVRLLARLRQQFPNRDWRTAPTLVSDYRFMLRRRRYPDRNILPDIALDRIHTNSNLTNLQAAALKALLDTVGRRLTLAEFQVRATTQVLRDLSSNQSRGMIVCAGTGTGKTLAFYLPALTYVAGLIKQNVHWTKALAIYPRNELLKDQFSESYREARLLDSFLFAKGARKLTIGTFFGPTPRRAVVEDVRDGAGWQAEGAGFACPFLRCPKCDGTLLWARADIEQRRERLHCALSTCDGAVEPDEVVLTRERIAKTPADVLFTTTETLNRQLSSSTYGHVFGLGVAMQTRPKIVLLDEVHTYHGVHGAQVAHVLRRWRHAVAAPVQFTGLSATLRDAVEFFSRLTGLHTAMVEEVSPTGEQIEEGMEYLLALRGDPVSGASLLSTTIQAAMLLRRMLEPNAGVPSTGLAGRRIYVFTDDLDVTNRLYHSLLDAEARNGFGVPIPGRQPLAALRAHARPDALERLLAGQSWRGSEFVGHDLSRPLIVTRTSSQDTGVARDADVIVATASLEVGYNDPEVGAILQHKAPRDLASFIQRRGRAGRRRTMRPWTTVVLSDYGRDRLAYQGYDQLFDPVLEARSLPILNRYVLRIQGVYCFMDWVAQQLPQRHRSGSVWRDFAGPAGDAFAGAQSRQQWESDLIRRVLEGGEEMRDLRVYLRKALRISEDEVEAVLWDPPRALMTAVLPTLLRRLESGWTRQPLRNGEAATDHLTPNAPLPDFVPQSLFNDLNLPEVTILAPRSRNQPDVVDESLLPILQGMKALAPGNVTRRFAPHRSSVSHWIAPSSLDDAAQNCPLEDFCAEYEELGAVQLHRGDSVVSVRCVRPWMLRSSVVPPQVLPTSRGAFTWISQIYPTGQGLAFEPPARSSWLAVVPELRFYTHNHREHAVTRRFALESTAQLRLKSGQERDLRIRFVDPASNEGVAVGFEKPVDAIVFRCRLPTDLRVGAEALNQAKIRALRSAHFRHRVAQDSRLALHANSFQREWLGQIYLSALTARALAGEIDLRSALALLSIDDLAGVLSVIFQTLDVDEQDEQADEQPVAVADGHRQRVHQVLLDLCKSDDIQAVLQELAAVLWQEPDLEWYGWAAERFTSTLAGALLEACQRVCPQFDAGDLVVDIEPGPRPHGAPGTPQGLREIWITEEALGGGGVVEEILRRYADDPAEFFRHAEAALEPSDFELVDSELTRVLALLPDVVELRTILATARAATDYRALSRANEDLREALGAHGVLASHAVMSALQIRVLRPGSSEATDELLHRLINSWHANEERLGIEIDARVFAYVASNTTAFGEALAHIAQVYHADPRWRFHVVYSLLWPRGQVVKARALSSYNPFSTLPETDRELVADCIADTIEEVSLKDGNWSERVSDALARTGVVRLVADVTQRRELSEAVLQLAARPLDIGFLQLHPQVSGMGRRAAEMTVTLRLREAVQ
jgi:superfamily II DNA or RNA helicase